MTVRAFFRRHVVTRAIHAIAWVLAQPHDVDQMMLCIVASNPVISGSITVDENGTVTSTEVKDDDILYVVTEAWPLVAARHAAEAG